MSERAYRLAAAGLLAFLALATAGAAARLGETADESILWAVGGPAAVRGEWSAIETTFQGPLALYANQLLAPVDPGRLPAPRFEPGELFRARAGMLPFTLLAGGLVLWIARRLFGREPALLALACFALHPLTSGYGALVAVDMAHAALALVALAAALLHAERATPARAAAVGAALGLALATKYLALLVAPAAVASVAVAAWKGPGGRARVAAALGALALAGLLALHAAYGFRAGLGATDPEAYTSGAMRAAAGLPVLGRALALLPEPLARGVDYQMTMGAVVPPGYFAGSYAERHPLYHAVGLLTKSPEAQVLAAAAVLVLALPRWLRRGADRARRAGVLLLLGAALVPFCYFSLAKLQVGIRYVLVCLPIGCVLIGGLLEPLRRRGARLGVALALVLPSAAALASAWPNGLGYFNAASGGPGRAWRLFVDSNADWGQMREEGEARLRARVPGLEVLGRADGPRLGRVALYVRHRAPRDPEDPARARHWVDGLQEIDHVDAAWLCYDASPESWRAAADADPRARAELAVALLGAGRVEEAEAEIARLPEPRRARPAALLALVRARARAPADDALRASLAGAWLAAERPDLALALAQGLPEARGVEAAALVRLERLDEAVALLETEPRAPEETLLLAELYRRRARVRDGIDLLERSLPALEGEPRERAADLLERLRGIELRWRGLAGGNPER